MARLVAAEVVFEASRHIPHVVVHVTPIESGWLEEDDAPWEAEEEHDGEKNKSFHFAPKLGFDGLRLLRITVQTTANESPD